MEDKERTWKGRDVSKPGHPAILSSFSLSQSIIQYRSNGGHLSQVGGNNDGKMVESVTCLAVICKCS